jgi:hypothetical protein
MSHRQRTRLAKSGDHMDVKAANNSDVFLLGISAFFHDSASALIKNGKIEAASQE